MGPKSKIWYQAPIGRNDIRMWDWEAGTRISFSKEIGIEQILTIRSTFLRGSAQEGIGSWTGCYS